MKKPLALDGFTGKFYETRNREDEQNQTHSSKRLTD